jgi:serine/threonine-protein kinase
MARTEAHSRPQNPPSSRVPDSTFQRLTSALAATYELQRELGGGGMSRVYLATERGLGRDVVIKTLPEQLTPEAAQRFKREIRTAATLQHPNIVPLLSAGEIEGVPYYTMPWVDGASLRDRIQRGNVPVAEAIVILRDVARALAAAHAKGVVHRDIKPENILLSSGAALVTDFGVARALSAATTSGGTGTGFQTATGMSVGTPAYMSPEQFVADPSIDHRTDIYAWGIVAYELLSGHHPFEGASGSGLLKAHMTSTPTPLPTLSPSVPRRVAEIVARSLQKDPAQRPANADAIVEALEGNTMMPAMGAGSRRRRATLIGGIAVVALVAIGVAALMRGNSTPARDARRIAVAPFRVGGAAPSVHYLREGLGDLMTPQLQAIPGVSTSGMRVMLEQWRRAGGSVDADLADDGARRAATAAGAGELILGDVVGTDAHLTINAQLVRVSDGTVLAPAKVEGPADSAVALATRLVATLLSVRDGATMDRVRNVVSSSPEAITAFLAGEHAYRRGRYDDAARSFFTAYQRDSTFALAALRINIVNGWLVFGDPIPGDWLRRAWTLRDRLSGADAVLLTALAGAGFPTTAPPARQYQRAMFAAAEQTRSAELWYEAGDFAFHRWHLSGDTADPRRALDAFRRAEALDSSFVPALEHQASLYAAFGDTAGERAAHQRHKMLDSTGDFFKYTDAAFRAAHGSVADAFKEVQRHTGAFNDLLFAANMLASDGDGAPPLTADRLTIGDAFARAGVKAITPSADPQVVVDWNSYWINTGRPRSFVAGSSPDSALIVDMWNTIAGLVWDGDSASAARSAAQLVKWEAATDTVASVTRSSAHLAVGLWSLSRGDTAGVEAARSALTALREPGSRQPFETAVIHEKLLAAHLAVARKMPDARTRLTELDSLLIDARVNRTLVANLGNLLVSRLWESVGDDRRALDAANRHHYYVGGPSFASSRLAARARIAERLGLRDEAITALKAYIGMRARSDPPFIPELRAARAKLATLEKEGAGR